MKLRILGLIGGALAVMFASQGASAGPFEDGLVAYESGNYAAAARLWRPLAEAGNIPAERNMAVLYLNGQGVPRNLGTAANWYGAAAAQGDQNAGFRLRDYQAQGPDGFQRWTRAFEQDRIGANAGNPVAQFSLSMDYAIGCSVPQDYKLAADWLRKAADQGFVPAERRLADFYHRGIGVPQDETLAALWNKRASAGPSPVPVQFGSAPIPVPAAPSPRY